MAKPDYTLKIFLKDLFRVKILSPSRNEDDFGDGMSFAYSGESLFEPGMYMFPFHLPNLERELKMINLAIDNSIKEIVCEDNRRTKDVL